MEFNKQVEEKELIVWQLRIFYPTLHWEDLEKLYYVWKSTNYKQEWVDKKLTLNLSGSSALEQRLEEKGLIVFKGKFPNDKGKNKKIKGLPDQVLQALSKNTVSLIIKLNLK